MLYTYLISCTATLLRMSSSILITCHRLFDGGLFGRGTGLQMAEMLILFTYYAGYLRLEVVILTT